jgi:hypothetical protein
VKPLYLKVSHNKKHCFKKTEDSVQEEDVTAREAVSDTKKEVQIWRKYPTKSSGTIIGEEAQENLESAIVTEGTRDVKSIDANC